MEYQISIRDTPGNKPDKNHFSHGENIMEGELESEGHSSILFALAVSKVPIYSKSLVCIPKPLLSKVVAIIFTSTKNKRDQSSYILIPTLL